MPTPQPATNETPIRVIIGSTVLTGRLWDNATARDLISQLPLTLPCRDLNSLEKIALLPRKLTMDGVPAGDDPFPRDIGYYAPGGDLVFYYGDVGYFNGIVRIGQFDGSMDAITSRMFTDFGFTDFPFGYGWMVSSAHGQTWHYYPGKIDPGNMPGTQTEIDRYVHDRVTVIVLSNSGDVQAASVAELLANKVFEP